MKFIRVYNDNEKRCKHDYILQNVDAIDCIYLSKKEKGLKRVCVACPNEKEKRTDVFYYLGNCLDKEKYLNLKFSWGEESKSFCWLDSNIAEELYEELETMLNKE